MKVILLILIFALNVFGYNREFICEDDFFTNTCERSSFDRLIASYPNRKLRDYHTDYIWQCAERYQINPMVLLIKLEQENSLVANWKTNHWHTRMNRATGYYVRNPKSLGFSNQVRGCARVLRKNFDAWTNQPAPVDGEWLPVSNASTYSLFRYCPHFGKVKNYNVVMQYATAWAGNVKFIRIRKDFEERID
jgi:hypothetical protein